ncbi:hypothetical protein MCOR27_007671 [Pyricularia oryzae]|uniref:Uncharacterized protein n=5 Tax=Pyricularia TaxID=48558 RepID=A0ABQ8NMV6_PYRGI|nr:uncharacterized protein MGG_16836 [Pyricularia oryzae 70-15]ELQ44640.1 hypothetical protein OOU_Y34scaffold00071g56 [Pyricularia oryzae Y34]KAH8847835.1 hypothetical protein MCOR01_001231 [Pyricularia oryzae]KAI6299494.1 hypothetical protein MCOR33_004626 [Pyricularia grisea]EHA52640.1 hypothetical protein MGG_16836 [Pyricularia oryzae 70-15]KAH9430236.1 hypothetical protein MCOR02_009955 [Pyricularia oryzae]
MRFSTIFAAAAAALPAASAPTAVSLLAAGPMDPTPVNVLMMKPGQFNYNWTVTNWEAGCARGGCYYGFDIAADEYTSYPKAPAFKAHCNGQNEGGPYTVCEMQDGGSAARRVAARLLERNSSDPVYIRVSYQYADSQPNAYFNWTGTGETSYNQFVAPPQTFNVTPSEVFGVA